LRMTSVRQDAIQGRSTVAWQEIQSLELQEMR
jgi:hypothetical protein